MASFSNDCMACRLGGVLESKFHTTHDHPMTPLVECDLLGILATDEVSSVQAAWPSVGQPQIGATSSFLAPSRNARAEDLFHPYLGSAFGKCNPYYH